MNRRLSTALEWIAAAGLLFACSANAVHAGQDSLTTSPAGVNGNVQFNKRGTFGADSTFTYSTSSKNLSVSTLTVTGRGILFPDGTVLVSSPSSSGGGGSGGASALEVFSPTTRSSPTASISLSDGLSLSVTGSTAVVLNILASTGQATTPLYATSGTVNGKLTVGSTPSTSFGHTTSDMAIVMNNSTFLGQDTISFTERGTSAPDAVYFTSQGNDGTLYSQMVFGNASLGASLQVKDQSNTYMMQGIGDGRGETVILSSATGVLNFPHNATLGVYGASSAGNVIADFGTSNGAAGLTSFFSVQQDSIVASVPLKTSTFTNISQIRWADGTIQVSSPAASVAVAGGGYALEPATVTIQSNKGEKASTMTITSLSPGVMHSLVTSSNVSTGLVYLSTETSGNYTANVNTSAPLTGGSSGSSGASLTLGVDPSSATLQGNSFNAANKLLQLSASSLIPNANVDPSSVTEQGNVFNGASQLVKLDASKNFSINGATFTYGITVGSVTTTSLAPGVLQVIATSSQVVTQLVSLSTQTLGNYVANANTNASMTGGSAGSAGASLSLAVSPSSGTLQGNTFNGASQLLQLTASSLVPNAQIDPSSVTEQGNTFNAASKLVQLNASTQLPAVDASLVLKVSSLAATAVTPASYTNTNLTVDQQGRITSASNGAGGSGSSIYNATATAGFPFGMTVSTINYNSASVGPQITVSTIATPASPTEGQAWLDGDKGSDAYYLNGIRQYGDSTIYVSTGLYTYANSTTISTCGFITNNGGIGTLTLPANFFRQGSTLHIWAIGLSSTTGSPTMTVALKFGTTSLVASGARTLGTGVTNLPSLLEFWITCYTTGASGTVFAQGRWLQAVGGLPTAPNEEMPANAATTTIDTTAAQTINLTFAWSAASTSNSWRVSNYIVSLVN